MIKKIIHSDLKKTFKREQTPKDGVKKPREITEKYLYNAGLAYLNRFSSSSENFRRILNKKIMRAKKFYGEVPEECDEWVLLTITRFTESGLLNDALYAQSSVTTMRRRGLSQKAILAKLQQKGLAEEQIKTAINLVDKDTLDRLGETLDSCERVAGFALAKRRRIGPYRLRDREEYYQKDLGILGRAGFSYDIAKSILQCDINELPSYQDL